MNPSKKRGAYEKIDDQVVETQTLPIGTLKLHGFFLQESMKDLCTGVHIEAKNDEAVLPALSFYWLAD